MYLSRDRLVILDADGTLIDSFHAVGQAFSHHGMDLGDLGRFQRRRKLLKYIGGLREFPKNLHRQLTKESRKQLKHTLTEIYRNQVGIFPGVASTLRLLLREPTIRVGIVSRNVTIEPEETLRLVLARHDVDCGQLDFLSCIPLSEEKLEHFRAHREAFGINPARSFVCGDEYRDYVSAIGAGMQPLIAAYGFEDYDRLVGNFRIPSELVANTPDELAARLCHALDLQWPGHQA